MSDMTHHEPRKQPPARLMAGLRQILPADAIIDQLEDLYPYECDGLSAYRALPMLVLLPEQPDQVKQIMQLCHQHQIPVIARGAGTGLSGGALPSPDAVLLSLARLNKILEVDPDNRTARVQPGVRNLAISDAASQYGLYYAPDPSSQIACSIGGNVAENSGGVHCLKYGLTVHNIQQLTLITAAGEQLNIGGSGLDSPGYDLLALLTGSEGMLGIIVEITVKLLPRPEDVRVLLASFVSISACAGSVSQIIAAGIIPAGLEMMDRLAIKAAEAFVHADYPLDAAALLLCEIDGSQAELDEQVLQLQQLLQHAGATEVRIAKDSHERELFWKGRKAAFPAVGRLSPDYYCMDGTIPRHQLAELLQQINALSEQYGLAVANVFHAGDGNLHPLILYDANKPGELEKTEEMGGRILELCIEAGGTITGEHGVGIEKINQMCIQFNEHELTQFHAIKSAFDPQGLLNPGKAVPTLHRCAEFGAMHVHHGKLSHPELERF